MLIGEISAKTGLTRDTIRFYERIGLIKVKRNASSNNYKNFSSENYRRLLQIKRGKQFGFTLNEISELLERQDSNQASCDYLRQKVTEKINDINRKIQELEEMKSNIFAGMQKAGTLCGDFVARNCSQINA